jgi:hypothetical protein
VEAESGTIVFKAPVGSLYDEKGLTADSESKIALLNMAHAWVLLARQAEKNFETKISETVAPKAQSI